MSSTWMSANMLRIAGHHVHIPPNNAWYAKLGTPQPGASISIAGVIIGTAEDTTPDVAIKHLPLELRDICFISEGDSCSMTSTIKGVYLYLFQCFDFWLLQGKHSKEKLRWWCKGKNYSVHVSNDVGRCYMLISGVGIRRSNCGVPTGVSERTWLQLLRSCALLLVKVS